MTAAREGMGLGLGMGLEMGGGSKRSGMYVGGRQVGNGSGRQDSTLRFADDDNNSWGERERIPSNVSSPFFFKLCGWLFFLCHQICTMYYLGRYVYTT
jgi:hypothetical protein